MVKDGSPPAPTIPCRPLATALPAPAISPRPRSARTPAGRTRTLCAVSPPGSAGRSLEDETLAGYLAELQQGRAPSNAWTACGRVVPLSPQMVGLRFQAAPLAPWPVAALDADAVVVGCSTLGRYARLSRVVGRVRVRGPDVADDSLRRELLPVVRFPGIGTCRLTVEFPTGFGRRLGGSAAAGAADSGFRHGETRRARNRRAREVEVLSERGWIGCMDVRRPPAGPPVRGQPAGSTVNGRRAQTAVAVIGWCSGGRRTRALRSAARRRPPRTWAASAWRTSRRSAWPTSPGRPASSRVSVC